MKKTSLLLFFATVLIACNTFAGDGSDEIINRIITAHGGAAAIEKAASVSATGKINAMSYNDTGRYARYLERDMKLRVETIYTRSSEMRILNKDKGYRTVNGGPFVQQKGPPYEAMLNQYSYLDLPYMLMKKAFTVTNEPQETLNGKKTLVLKLVDKNGSEKRAWIDAENGRIIQFSGYFAAGPMKMALTAGFEDYRMESGIMLPFKIVNYSGAQRISETSIDKYEVGKPIDVRLFTP